MNILCLVSSVLKNILYSCTVKKKNHFLHDSIQTYYVFKSGVITVRDTNTASDQSAVIIRHPLLLPEVPLQFQLLCVVAEKGWIIALLHIVKKVEVCHVAATGGAE